MKKISSNDIVKAAKAIAKKQGLGAVTRQALGNAVGCASGSVAYYLGRTFGDLLKELHESGEYELGGFKRRRRLDHKCMRKQQLLEIGEKLALQHGYYGVKTTHVINEAHCGREVLYYHFGDSEGYLNKLLHFCIERETLKVLYTCVHREEIPIELKRKVINECM